MESSSPPGRHVLAPLAVLLLVLAACGDGNGNGAPGGSRSGPSDLDGRAFVSRSVTGHDLVAGTEIRLSFAGGQVSARAGCNSLGAPYDLRGGRLVVEGDGMSTTDIGCDAARHAQDEWLAAFLLASPTVELAGDELSLASGTTTIQLGDREVVDPDRPLVGTAWRVDTVITGDAASSVPEGSVVVLELVDGTSFRATARGCTSAGGPVVVGDGALTFGDFAVDAIGCPPPWEATLEVLRAGEVSYRIDAARLTLDAGPVGISATAEAG